MDDAHWTFSHWFLFESSPEEAEVGAEGTSPADEADDPADEG